jgi:hypothetical protein
LLANSYELIPSQLGENVPIAAIAGARLQESKQIRGSNSLGCPFPLHQATLVIDFVSEKAILAEQISIN